MLTFQIKKGYLVGCHQVSLCGASVIMPWSLHYYRDDGVYADTSRVSSISSPVRQFKQEIACVPHVGTASLDNAYQEVVHECGYSFCRG